MAYANSYASRYRKTPEYNSAAQMRAERLARQQYRMENARIEFEKERLVRQAQAEAIKRAEEERRNAGFLTRALSTVGDFVGNVGQGLGKGIEGIVDFGAGLVGGIGGAFNSGFKDNMQNFIAKDHVGDSYGKWLTGATKYSYLNDSETAAGLVRGVGQGIGQIVPSLALSAIPGVGIPLSTASFMSSAAGNSTEAAYQSGADYYSGLGYGTLSGIIEGGIEKLSGGIGGTKAGKVLGKQLGKSTLGKLGITMAGEGLEEVASDLINPALKGITGVNNWSEVGEEYKQLPEQLPMTFAVGGLTGLAMGGAGKVANNIVNRKKENFMAKQVPQMDELTDGMNQNAQTKIQPDNAQINMQVDIPVIEQKGINLQPTSNLGVNSQPANDTRERLNSAVKNGTMSESLINNKTEIRFKPIAEAKSYAQKEALKTVNILSDSGSPTVLTDELPANVHGQLIDGVSYINANLPQSQIIKQAAVHEFTHTLEGTKEYEDYAGALLSQMQNSDSGFSSRLESIKNTYREQLDGLAPETQDYIIKTEMVSQYTQSLFTDERQIKRLVNTNKNLAVRIWEWIKNKIALLKARRGGMEKYQTLHFLQRAESLYSKAVGSRAGGVNISNMDSFVSDKKQQNTVKTEMARYSIDKKNTSKYNEIDRNPLNVTHEFTKVDFAVLRNYAMTRNSENKGQYPIDYGYTANHFNIYRNNGTNNIKIIKSLDIDVNYDIIEKIKENIRNGKIYRDASEIRKDIDGFSNSTGNNGGNNDSSSRKLADDGNGGFYSGKSRRDGVAAVPKGSGNRLGSRNQPNVKPDDIRYSLAETQSIKAIANAKQDKVYSKKEITESIDSILEDIAGNSEYAAVLSGGKKQSVIDSLFKALNTGTYAKREIAAKKIADYLIKETALQSMYAEDVREQTLDENTRIIDEIKGYMGNLDLSGIKSELEHEYDVKGARGIMLRWGGKGGMAVDVAAQELNDNGITIRATNEADAFKEIKKLYDSAKASIKRAANSAVKDVYTSEEIVELHAQLTKQVLDMTDSIGEPSVRATLREKTKAKLNKMRERLNNARLHKKTPKMIVDSDGNPTTAQVLTEMPTRKTPTKEKISDTKLNAEIHFTNAQAGIEHAAKKMGIKGMDSLTHAARAATAAAEQMLDSDQYNRAGKRVGKGFKAIMQPIYNKAKTDSTYKTNFFEYMLHWHNIDRMAVEKPVFNTDVSAQDSTAIIKQLDKKYPEFSSIAKEVWNYNDNLLTLRADYGLITHAQAETMRKMYPHYVPTFRDTAGEVGTGALSGKYNMAVKETVKSAIGSNRNILPLDVIIARQTMEVIKAAKVNEIALSLYNASKTSKDNTFIEVLSKEKIEDLDVDYDKIKPKNNEITFFADGKRVALRVTSEIFEGFKALAPQDTGLNNFLVNGVKKANGIFKKLVTEYNPFFLLRNAFRDIQEAMFYSKHGVGKLIKTIPRAVSEIKNNGMLWQQYKASGGLSSNVFDYNKGVDTDEGGVKAILTKPLKLISKVNMYVEQLPRFSEFILSIESGASFEQALLNSADVTTNFSRAGTTAKILNSTLIPFLNPSIQGFSKLWRTVTGRKTSKEWLNLIVRAFILGIGLSAINDLLMGDDEEYVALNQRDKDNYYLIKVGDTFLKLPKGRVNGVIGSIYLHAKNVTSGKQSAAESFKEWGASAVSGLTPVDSMSRTIFSPFADVKNNKTWYGGEIEGRKWDNTAPKDRHDESTSSIAVAIGKAIGYSPKKIHYLIDQYSGIIGDVILPLTTPKAERNIVAYNFTVDPVTQNRYSSDFYMVLDKANYAKSDGDLIATAKVRYLTKVAGEISDLYKLKQEIEKKDIPTAEKSQQSKAVQILINEAYKKALESVNGINFSGISDSMTKMTENAEFKKLSPELQQKAVDSLFDNIYKFSLSKNFGTELSAREQLIEKLPQEKVHMYLAQINELNADKDKNGKTILNSRKDKIIAYINSLSLLRAQKLILMELAGYKVKASAA